MMFQAEHIDLIREGEKTVTRRDWDDDYNAPNVGTIVAATTEMFTPDAEADCFIQITAKRTESLGDMRAPDARQEGDYDFVTEYIDAWEDINGEGSWDWEKDVTVVEFEYVGRSRPTESNQAPGDQQ